MVPHDQVLRNRWLAIFLGGLMLAMMVGLPAEAQRGRDNRARIRVDWGELRRPQYEVADLMLLVNTLELDDDQRIIASDFLTEYDDAFNDLREEARGHVDRAEEQLRLVRDAGRSLNEGELANRVRAQVEALKRQHAIIADVFLDDVQSILYEAQLQRWPEYERALRRGDLIRGGELSGEDIDLFEVVDRAELSDSTLSAIAPILDSYATELDAVLVARDERLEDDPEDALRDALQSLFRGNMDADEVLRIARDQRIYRVRVRDTNLRFGEQIRGSISDPEERDAFNRALKEAAFPRIYRRTYARSAFEAAADLPDVEASRREAIDALFDLYELRMVQFNERIERVTLQDEPRETEQRAEEIMARLSRTARILDRQENRIRVAFDDREVFEAGMVLQLHQLLTEEQIRLLPRRR